jgi:hypothetical protein
MRAPLKTHAPDDVFPPSDHHRAIPGGLVRDTLILSVEADREREPACGAAAPLSGAQEGVPLCRSIRFFICSTRSDSGRQTNAFLAWLIVLKTNRRTDRNTWFSSEAPGPQSFRATRRFFSQQIESSPVAVLITSIQSHDFHRLS